MEGGARVVDLTGMTFGRWGVIAFDSIGSSGRACWLCRCSCGHESVVRGDLLRRGVSQSCGCLAREHSAERLIKHGYCADGRYNGNPTYVSWKGMKQRCYDPNVDQYPRYGGRGVNVCDRWRDSFENFVADMGERLPGTTLDRIDPYGNYEPGNCRWADVWTQNANQRLGNHWKRMSRGGASRYKGVSRHSSGKFQATCTVRGRRAYLGTFSTEEEAALAYDQFASRHYGEYAWLNSDNFPELTSANLPSSCA